MSKTPIYVIRLASGKYAGSPIVTVALTRGLAGSFTDKAEAEVCAKLLGDGATVEQVQ